MHAIDSVLDQSSGEFAVADVWALGSSLDALEFECGLGESLSSGIGGSNPSFDILAAGFNCESPVSAESGDLFVLDGFGAEWIHDRKGLFLENYSGTHPDQVNRSSDNDHDADIENRIFFSAWVKNALNQVNRQEQVSQRAPSEIGLWAKGVVHAPIITGVLVSKREVSND